MITYLKGDMFCSPAQVLVNAVNTVGVMGKGVALEFKKRYPDMFHKYQKICEEKAFDTGMLYLWREINKWILLFPTKKHWRNPSKLEYIEQGLKKFADNWQGMGIETIAFPRLGCGNGGLDWEVVRPLMEQYLKPLPIQILIYVDQYKDCVPEHQQPGITERWLHRQTDAIGFEMLKDDLLQLLKKNNAILLPDGVERHVQWEDSMLTITNGDTVTIPEADLCNLWDFVRASGVITANAIPEHLSPHFDVLLLLLQKLEYLQEVIVSPNGVTFDKTSNGFQYTKG